MRILPRILAVAGLLYGLFALMRHVEKLQAAGVESNQLVSYYFVILGLVAVTAIIVCVTLLPIVGEFLGSFMFTPNQKIERSPHADALAKLNAGDFEGAVEEYKEVFENDPQDIHAASEVVRIYCDKLGDSESAGAFLAEALAVSDRTPEEAAFLSQRLVDVCWNYQRDAIRARAILIKIAEDMPETREAANALHRLQEIDRALNESEFMARNDSSTPGSPSA